MDIVDKSRRSALMARVRQKNTDPELKVRKIAHALGYRFRLHRSDLPGRPDVVFPMYNTVVLIHGCFWHRHKGCIRCTSPKSRAGFWASKFQANVERDRKNISDLRNLGWKVAVIWECETIDSKVIRRKLREALRKRRRQDKS